MCVLERNQKWELAREVVVYISRLDGPRRVSDNGNTSGIAHHTNVLISNKRNNGLPGP